jgi:hypothetical protein
MNFPLCFEIIDKKKSCKFRLNILVMYQCKIQCKNCMPTFGKTGGAGRLITGQVIYLEKGV